jgi:hypothetical protein
VLLTQQLSSPNHKAYVRDRSVGQLLTFHPNHEGLIENAFSIQIPTYSARQTVCARTLQYLANFSSPFLLDVFIIWIDRKDPNAIPTFNDYKLHETRVPIHFLASRQQPSLNDRFLIPSLLRTKIILSWDDDIIVSSSRVNKLFTFYLQNNLTTYIVGVFARGCKGPRYQFHDRNYTLVLTGFAFLTIDLLELYHRPEYRIGREEVTRLFSGEDMLINFITTSVYGTKPILVYVPLHFHSTRGISTTSAHMMTRHYLCRTFQRLFWEVSVQNSSDNS